MKVRSRIPRIILYAILLAAILATWMVVSVLEAPAPPLPQDDLDAFKRALAEELGVLLASRAAALSELDTADDAVGERGQPGRAGLVGGSGFESARGGASRILEEAVGVTQPGDGLDGLGAFPELDEALDRADELYGNRLAEGTAIQVSIYREAMEAESADYIRYLGYEVLINTLGRDTLRYRMAESLPLHDIKTTLYQTEFDTMRVALRESRSGANALAHAGLSELDARYDGLLAGIVAGISESRLGPDFEPTVITMGSEVLAELTARLAGFRPVRIQAGPGLEIPGIRRPDRTAWLASERSRGEAFDSAARGEVND